MKKQLLVLITVICVPGIIWPAIPGTLPQTPQQESWYDLSKRQAKKYMPYVPGAVTGLSGASLLALKRIYGSENPAGDTNATDQVLTWLAGSPVMAYETVRGLLPYYLYGDIDASGNLREKGYEFLRNHNALKSYAPYLLGTSAALLAAPYLYSKYKQYRQESERQAELIKKIETVSDQLLTYYSYQQSRLGKFTKEEIAEQVIAMKEPLMNLIMQREQGRLTDERFDTLMTELLGSRQSYITPMEKLLLRMWHGMY